MVLTKYHLDGSTEHIGLNFSKGEQKMKQKTAIMELIKSLQKDRDYALSSESKLDNAYASGLNIAINEAQQLLEKEKEQIMQAYNEGLFDGSVTDMNNIPFNDYYNKTYLEESKQ